MGKEKIEMMVEGGKAVAGAEIGQKLGPMKIPIPNVLKVINEKTAAFKGVKVPVKLIIDTDTKEFTVEVGTPPVSELIKKELGLEKGSATANKLKVANAGIEHLIKIAKMKMDSMFTDSLKAAVKTVAGSCNSLGVLVEGKLSNEFNKDLEAGKFDKEIKEEKTTVSPEKTSQLKIQLDTVQEELRKMAEKIAAEEAAKAAASGATAAPKEGEVKEGEAVPAKEGEAPKPGAAPAGKPAPGAKPGAAAKPTAPGKEAPKEAPKKK